MTNGLSPQMRCLHYQCLPGFDDHIKNQRHIRHFYHVQAVEPLPKTWSHEERFGVGEPTMFTFYWCAVDDLNLIAEHDALVDQLVDQLWA